MITTGKPQNYANHQNCKNMVLKKSEKCKLNQDKIPVFLFVVSTAQGHVLEG